MFGTLSPDAPPLADYIGNLIGARIGRVMHGKPKILGTTSQILHNNWKLYIENVKDTYHASLLHTFFTTFRISRLSTGGGVADRRERRQPRQLHPRRPETATDRPTATSSMPTSSRMRDGLQPAPTRACSTRSTSSATTSPLQILSVFPNFVLQQINNSIALRLVLPKGPDETELQWIYLGFEDDDAAMTERRLLQSNLVGPAGYVSMEDGAVGGFVQRAIVGSRGRDAR